MFKSALVTFNETRLLLIMFSGYFKHLKNDPVSFFKLGSLYKIREGVNKKKLLFADNRNWWGGDG